MCLQLVLLKASQLLIFQQLFQIFKKLTFLQNYRKLFMFEASKKRFVHTTLFREICGKTGQKVSRKLA